MGISKNGSVRGKFRLVSESAMQLVRFDTAPETASGNLLTSSSVSLPKSESDPSLSTHVRPSGLNSNRNSTAYIISLLLAVWY